MNVENILDLLTSADSFDRNICRGLITCLADTHVINQRPVADASTSFARVGAPEIARVTR